MALVEAELSKRVIGRAIRVHRSRGPGFLEKVYEQALAIELRKANIAFEQQKTVLLYYENETVGEHRLDLIVDARIVLELNACKEFEDIHFATVRSYLKATKIPLGLGLNFARPTLEVRRVVLTG